MDGGRRAAAGSRVQRCSVATELCLWAEDGAYWLPFDFFFLLLPTAHKTVIILAYAVWRGPSGWSGCKSSKRIWTEAYPSRRGRRCKLKLTRSEWSILTLRDLVLHLRNSNHWRTALLCCIKKSNQCRWILWNTIFLWFKAVNGMNTWLG